MTSTPGPATAAVRAVRDVLLAHRTDWAGARAAFAWPELTEFNFASDWFDDLVRERGDQDALCLVDVPAPDAPLRRTRRSFAELGRRSCAAARWLTDAGLRRGDRVLVMLDNHVCLWEVMLGAIRIGAVLVPTTPLLSGDDLADRLARSGARVVIAQPGATERVDAAGAGGDVVRVWVDTREPSGTRPGPAPAGWRAFDLAGVDDGPYVAKGVSRAGDPLLLYFTSGTTSRPKLVEHSMVSYPVGHLSTLYWMGLLPGDRHLNISSPGWGKHAWSNVFTPWLAGATVVVHTYERFDARALLRVLAEEEVTSLCAPPTVWRLLLDTGLEGSRVRLREALSAGEPLNASVIDRVRAVWGVTIRDGYGQTETTCQVGTSPGMTVPPGAMGRAMPGFDVTPGPGTTGELCLRLDPPPLALMTGYREDGRTTLPRRDVHATGDVVSCDDHGVLTFVGRSDDVFKASDYRLSPFELESALLRCEAVAQVAVVPAPDPLRTAVPKAFVEVAAGHAPDATTAALVLDHARRTLAGYARVRRVEFAALPTTISGKIRRVELRDLERRRAETGESGPDVVPPGEYRDR